MVDTILTVVIGQEKSMDERSPLIVFTTEHAQPRRLAWSEDVWFSGHKSMMPMWASSPFDAFELATLTMFNDYLLEDVLIIYSCMIRTARLNRFATRK